jgi:hypothetical protein
LSDIVCLAKDLRMKNQLVGKLVRFNVGPAQVTQPEELRVVGGSIWRDPVHSAAPAGQRR